MHYIFPEHNNEMGVTAYVCDECSFAMYYDGIFAFSHVRPEDKHIKHIVVDEDWITPEIEEKLDNILVKLG